MIIKSLGARVDMYFGVLLVLMQGFAIHIGGKPVSVTIALAMGWATYKLLQRGYLRRSIIFAFLVFAFTTSGATLASVWSGGDPHALSWAYLIVMYFLIAVVRGISLTPRASNAILDGFCNLMAALSVAGVIQQLLQISSGIYVDYTILPSSFILDSYNTRVPISANSTFFKSNGVLLLEPSFLSKLAALAIVVEVYQRKRTWILGFLSLGILTSFSGSGLLLLLIAGPFIFNRFSNNKLAMIVLAMLAAIYLSSGFADVFIDRISEFSVKTSSAYIRFVAPYVAIVNGWDEINLLWGNGLSTLERSVIGGFSFEKMSGDVTALAYDVTLVKILVELGIVGLVGYGYFYARLFFTRKLEFGFALSVASIVWVTSGALFSAPIMLLLALLTNAMAGGGNEKSSHIRDV